MTKRDEDKLNAAIARAIAGIKPPERLTVSQWADKHRRLSAESSAEVGRWRTSRTPYLAEIMDAFTDPYVKEIAVGASSQVGKSECLNNMIGYAMDQDPGSILFIQPTTIDAKEYSKLRLAPMIRDTKCLRQKVADPKSRDTGNTILQKSYPGGILTLCGSTEAHALCSKPMRYLFGDERDRWTDSAGDEGDPWELATARQITFYNSKAVEVSTPTVKGASAIDRSFKEGTMERWKTCCPHCGTYNEIVFEDIRFSYEEQGQVFEITDICYACPTCGGVSSEQDMKSRPARWEAEAPEAYRLRRKRSFWLTSWVSPWASWESTIAKYLAARGDTKRMQVVYNTRFGKLWEHRGGPEDEEGMMARREDYGTDPDGSPVELPDGVLFLTCGVDTQDDRLEYEVVGYGHFDESWGIKKGVIMGRPDTEEVWLRLDDVLDHVYRFRSGLGLRISMTYVDEGGHFTQDVRFRCRERFAKKVFAIKGRGGQDIPYTSPPKKQNIVLNGTALGTCWQCELGVDAGKQLIRDNLSVKTPGPRYCHYPIRDDYGTAYFHGLLSEHLVYKKGHKNPWQWEKIPGHERNEPLDCRNYANAAKKAASPDMDAIEARLRGASPTPRPAVPASSVHPAPRRTRTRRTTGGVRYDNEW